MYFLGQMGLGSLRKTWCPKVKTMFLEELLGPICKFPRKKPSKIQIPFLFLGELCDNLFFFLWAKLGQGSGAKLHCPTIILFHGLASFGAFIQRNDSSKKIFAMKKKKKKRTQSHLKTHKPNLNY